MALLLLSAVPLLAEVKYVKERGDLTRHKSDTGVYYDPYHPDETFDAGGVRKKAGFSIFRPREASSSSLVMGAYTVEPLGLPKNGLKWTEGPLWLDGRLVFSDTVENSIWSWSEELGFAKVKAAAGGCMGRMVNNSKMSQWEIKLRKMHPHAFCGIHQHEPGPNGLFHDVRTDLLINCQHGGRRVIRISRDEFAFQDVVAASYQGLPLNSPNDVAIHPDGSIFFTDPYYGFLDKERLHLGDNNYTEHRSALGFAGVYRVPAPWRVGGADIDAPHLVIQDISRPNGIAVDPDQTSKALWVSECCQGHGPKCPGGTARWIRYVEKPASLFTHEAYVRDRVIEWEAPQGSRLGCSDGFKLLDRSAENKAPLIVSACPKGVCVVDTGKADNHVLEYVPFPSRVSNVAFGGDGWLYVTGEQHLWRIELTEEAHGWATKQKEQYAADVAEHGDPAARDEL